MKTLILTAAILISGLTKTQALDLKKSDLKSTIETTIVYDELFELMNTEKKALVRISLTVNENGKIQVLETNYSNELVKNSLIEKLTELDVADDLKTDDVYAFEFIFERI